ncbi:unnamed protein product [Cuscuta europaea]|uniref:Ubiquitin-like protease family profile domain-containing protein n=1 Tax=Cuscuta europaea TaxID=41803 RepID=A0A9P0ZIV7_CUSEU|nr:unnamed protein product [Cuscuta europaea]
MKDSLCATFGKRMIWLPYNEGFHWILIVICSSVNKGYIFNSISSLSNIRIRKDLALTYRVASARNGDGKPITWHNVKCARQNGNTECGYYTM